MSAAGWNHSSELFGEHRLGGTNISKDILVVSNVDPENSFPSFLLIVNHFVYPLVLLHFSHCDILPIGEGGEWEPTLIEHSLWLQKIDTFIPLSAANQTDPDAYRGPALRPLYTHCMLFLKLTTRRPRF